MNGSVTVRQAEDLEGGALTYAEIKAIASGNPAVMEKVKVDTEIRKLDQLRASHVNQQHNIRWALKNLPDDIRRSNETEERITKDIATREANTSDEFTMTVGNRTFSGKGAREEAAKALNEVILSWANDQTAQVRAKFKGFEIVSRGHPLGRENDPELYVRGALTYRAQLNPENPLGTIQSIEHVLRSLDRRAEDEKQQIQRQEKAFSEYKEQLGRPFEHEERLKELQLKQAQLNAALDLDKNERQVAPDDPQTEKENTSSTFVERTSHSTAEEMTM
jgi:hypothetical protein